MVEIKEHFFLLEAFFEHQLSLARDLVVFFLLDELEVLCDFPQDLVALVQDFGVDRDLVVETELIGNGHHCLLLSTSLWPEQQDTGELLAFDEVLHQSPDDLCIFIIHERLYLVHFLVAPLFSRHY